MNANALLQYLAGKKTYIIAAAGIAYLLWCQHAGLVPSESILGIFAFLGLGTLRHGLKTTLESLVPPAEAPLADVAAAELEKLATPAAPVAPVAPKPPGPTSGRVMVPLVILIAGLSALLLLFTGCGTQTPPARIAFNSVSTAQQSADAVLSEWAVYVQTQRAANAAITDPAAHEKARAALQAKEDAFRAGWNKYLAIATAVDTAGASYAGTTNAPPASVPAAIAAAAADLAQLLVTLKQ